MRRALRLVSGEDATKKAGNAFSQHNRATMPTKQRPLPGEAEAARRKAQYRSVSSRAVAVPRVGRGPPRREFAPVEFVARRKAHEDIARETDGYERDMAPMYSAADLGGRTEQIARMQDAYLEADGAPQPQPTRAQSADPGPAESEESRMHRAIVEEIRERRAFLEEMTALGRAAEHEAAIRAQIAERMNDLRKLQRLMADG